MLSLVLNPSLYHFAFAAWPPAIVGFSKVLLGLVVLFREKGSRVSSAFAWLTLGGACWMMATSGIYAANSRGVTLWWAKVGNVNIVYIPTALLYFTLIVVQQLKRFGVFLVGANIVSSLFALSILLTNQFVTGLQRFDWGPYVRLGQLSIPSLIFFFPCPPPV